jgi:hypothetical protein
MDLCVKYPVGKPSDSVKNRYYASSRRSFPPRTGAQAGVGTGTLPSSAFRTERDLTLEISRQISVYKSTAIGRNRLAGVEVTNAEGGGGNSSNTCVSSPCRVHSC